MDPVSAGGREGENASRRTFHRRLPLFRHVRIRDLRDRVHDLPHALLHHLVEVRVERLDLELDRARAELDAERPRVQIC